MSPKLTALIVDDERLARVALRTLLEERDDVTVVGEANDVASARTQLAALKPDVVFLDVQMPGGSGFELLATPIAAKVVFCTAYEQHALRAFEVNALDYLMKPVGPEQVARALLRVRGSPPPPEPTAVLSLDEPVALHEGQAMRLVAVRDIAFVQAADDYSEVHLRSGEMALVDVTLKRWQARLPETHFVKIHRSCLVNVGQVTQVVTEDGRFELELAGGRRLAVSRRLATDVRERLGARAP